MPLVVAAGFCACLSCWGAVTTWTSAASVVHGRSILWWWNDYDKNDDYDKRNERKRNQGIANSKQMKKPLPFLNSDCFKVGRWFICINDNPTSTLNCSSIANAMHISLVLTLIMIIEVEIYFLDIHVRTLKWWWWQVQWACTKILRIPRVEIYLTSILSGSILLPLKPELR